MYDFLYRVDDRYFPETDRDLSAFAPSTDKSPSTELTNYPT